MPRANRKATTQATPPGANLHLGGKAYANPALEPLLRPIEEVLPYPGNPRRHDQDNITGSIRDHGLYAAVVVQSSTGHTIVGNGRRQALLDLGATRIPVVPQDVDDRRAAAIVARDNRSSDLSSYDDELLLELLTPMDAELLALSGYEQDDLDLLRGLDGPDIGPVYTRKADPITYQPTMENPPPVAELVNRSRVEDLSRQIRDADLPAEVRDFLLAGAQRHLVFNYAKIAEFYAHADSDVQDLMEASALVLIDYEDALAHGYVRLSSRLADLLDADLRTRAELDAEKGVTGA